MKITINFARKTLLTKMAEVKLGMKISTILQINSKYSCAKNYQRTDFDT